MNAKLTNIIKYSVSLAVAIVLLWFSFRSVKWDDFAASLSQCDWGFVLLGMLAGVFAFWLRGLRWRMTLLPIDPSTKKSVSFNAINISYLANLVLPRIGEFVRCGYITANSSSDRDGKKLASYDKVLGTVVVDRSCDILSLLTLLVVLLLLGWGRFGSFFVERMWTPLSEKLDFSLWWILIPFALAVAVVVYALYRFRNSAGIFGKISGFALGIWNGFTSCLKMDRAWLFFLYTALIWLMYWLMSASTLWAVKPVAPDLVGNLDLIDALFLMIAGSLSSLVPVPGGFGAFHYIVALAVSTVYGIPFEIGIVFATLSHESQAVTQAVCGISSYISETLKRRK